MAAEEDPQALFERLLLLTGQMNYMWTNTESLLIHVIAGLCGTEKDKAVIIFLTLNTTRARIDLVDRLAKMPGRDAGERDAILDCTRTLARFSGIRNRFNHCIYSFDAESGSPQTILMRIADRKTGIEVGRTERIDREELARVEATLSDLAALNRRIWQLIARQDYPA
jgi:hypothetical protein